MPKLLEWKVVHSAWVMWGLGRLQVICPLQGDTNEMHSSEKLSHQIETLLWTPFCSFKIWMARETKSYFFRLLNKFMPEENYVFMISYTDLEECSNYKVWSSLLWSKNLKIYLYYLPKITKSVVWETVVFLPQRYWVSTSRLIDSVAEIFSVLTNAFVGGRS